MSDDLAAMITEAEQRGARSLLTEPRACSARYDLTTGRVHVELTNGCAFAFPARIAPIVSDPSTVPPRRGSG